MINKFFKKFFKRPDSLTFHVGDYQFVKIHEACNFVFSDVENRPLLCPNCGLTEKESPNGWISEIARPIVEELNGKFVQSYWETRDGLRLSFSVVKIVDSDIKT